MSVVIAFVLWFLATMLEARLEQAPVDAPPNSAASPESRRDGPSAAPEVAPPLSCEASENGLKKTIERARACNVDDDCTLFDYGYPIDCMTSVAKSAIPLLRVPGFLRLPDGAVRAPRAVPPQALRRGTRPS
jgi:hypothetical protein